MDGRLAGGADHFGRPLLNDGPEHQGLFPDDARVVDRLVPDDNDQFTPVLGHKAGKVLPLLADRFQMRRRPVVNFQRVARRFVD